MAKITTFSELKVGEFYVIIGPPAGECLYRKISARKSINLSTGIKVAGVLLGRFKVMAISFEPEKLLVELLF